MASYSLFGTGADLFDAIAGANSFDGIVLKDALLYWTPTEFGVVNGDGSKTFFKGSGLQWDAENGFFTAGTITSIEHYTNGQFTDRITGITGLEAVYLGQSLFASNLKILAFGQSDDIMDARIRAGNAVLPVDFWGYEGNDTLYGGAGHDKLQGGIGNDSILGGGGNDRIIGDDVGGPVGLDRLYGGDGNDKIAGYAGKDVLSGGNGNDTMFGGADADTFVGGAGTDTMVYEGAFSSLAVVRSATGNLSITSGGSTDKASGVERIAADDGVFSFDTTTGKWVKVSSVPGIELFDPSTTLKGTAGADDLLALYGVETIRGYAGDDLIRAIDYDGAGVLVFAGDGNDTIDAFGRIYGQNGNDRIDGGGTISGGAGNDLIWTKAGNDTVSGGSGTDSALFFQSFNDLTGAKTATGFTVQTREGLDTFSSIERLVVDEGTYAINLATGTLTLLSDISANEMLDPNARLNGTQNGDSLSLVGTDKSVAYGLGGNDSIQGATLNDLLFGGAGDDSLGGDYSPGLGQFSSSNDRLYGGDGNDVIGGGRGNDRLYGGNGNDTIGGSNGDDILSAGDGADRFSFVYNNDRFIQASIGSDVITDFEVGVDALEFSFRIVQPPGTGTVSMNLTADGWLLTTNYGGSVLLEGVTTAGLTLDDLIA